MIVGADGGWGFRWFDDGFLGHGSSIGLWRKV
jgi:hypothetical protein